MRGLNDITNLIAGGAEYLSLHRLCDEDALPHGRRAYVWPLLAWLYRHDGSVAWQKQAETVADELLPTVGKNPDGETVIFPGLHHRRNYSTNAIDCGTFVDSFYDFKTLQKNVPHPLEQKVREVALGYIQNKIVGRKDVHDQYLWAATGLARFLEHHADDPAATETRRALEETLHFWLRHHEPDGYSPYMQSDPFMGGLTPYYFSRRIAFSWYIIEKAKLNRPDIEEKLLRAGLFLASLFRPDGVKEMRLEAKRYYFWGAYEADSHPFDIYVWHKMYEKTGDMAWVRRAAVSLKRLTASRTKNGAIRSRAETRGVKDWQCDTMRTGHLAWLTRLSDDFLAKISAEKTESFTASYDFARASSSDRILLIGNERRWIHFVVRKGMIAGHAGERLSGIIAGKTDSINRLDIPCLFHYRARGNPLLFLRFNKKGIRASFQYALFHTWDCLYHKRDLRRATAFFKDGLLGYLLTGLTTLSTEFATNISGLSVTEDSITHDLTLSDFSGSQKTTIGRREIRLGDDGVVIIRDTLTAIGAVGALRLSLPEGTTAIHGPNVIKTTFRL